MNDTDTPTETIEFHVPAHFVEGYTAFCPLVPKWGTKEGDEYIEYGEDNKEQRFSAADVVLSPGFLVVELGDIDDPDHTLNTAASAIFQSLSALFSACAGPVQYERIRTSVELSQYMLKYRFNFSHIIIVGHGSEDGIPFMDQPSPMKGNAIAGLLGADGSPRDIELISLCCHTGCEALSSSLSKAVGVRQVIAPISTFDVRWAVHFVTGYFLDRYLEGKPVDKAVCDAALNKNATPMAVWQEGVKVFEC